MATPWADGQIAWWSGDSGATRRESVEDAIRATIHEAARRVCDCQSVAYAPLILGHTDRCPARKVLEMEAGK